MLTGHEFHQVVAALTSAPCLKHGKDGYVSLRAVFQILRAHSPAGCEVRFNPDDTVTVTFPEGK